MTSDKSSTAEPSKPRKKGGGDGSAKSATPKSQPAKTGKETNRPDPAVEPAQRSRKITTRG